MWISRFVTFCDVNITSLLGNLTMFIIFKYLYNINIVLQIICPYICSYEYCVTHLRYFAMGICKGPLLSSTLLDTVVTPIPQSVNFLQNSFIKWHQ